MSNSPHPVRYSHDPQAPLPTGEMLVDGRSLVSPAIYDSTLPQDIIINNRETSEVESKIIASRLVELETDFFDLTQTTYDEVLVLDSHPIHSAVRQCGQSIRAHRYALSLLRTLPLELLQRIFSASVELDPETRLERLATLSAVCRHWRAAALSYPMLWTELPSLPLKTPPLADLPLESWITQMRERVQIQIDMCRMFFQRSGDLPLTIRFTVAARKPRGWDGWEELMGNLLDTLTNECHRWESVRFVLHSCYYHRYLAPIRGKIPLLKTVLFTMVTPAEFYDDNRDEGKDGEYEIQWLSCAPMLRSVNLCTSRRLASFPLGSPLEDVTIALNAVPNAFTIYKSLLESQSRSLRSFRFVVDRLFGDVGVTVLTRSDIQPLSIPCNLPNLAMLDLGAVEGASRSFLTHLTMLTLPSLKVLCLPYDSRWYGPVDDEVYPELLNLIRRSGCKLERLTGHKPMCASVSQDGYLSEVTFEIVARSPSLTKIKLGHPDAEGLQWLMLDPQSPAPTLPVLEKLRINNDDAEDEETWLENSTIKIMDLIASRRNLQGPPYEGHLKEVELDGYDIATLQYSLVKWETAALGHLFVAQGVPGPDTVDLETINLVKKATASMANPAQLFRGSAARGSNSNMNPHRKALDCLDQLEELDFQNVSSLGIGRGMLLARMTGMRRYTIRDYRGTMTEEELERLHDRISTLLAKWKPYILRDIRVLPYAWFCGGTKAHFRWQLNDSGELDETDEELWTRLTTARQFWW